MKTTVDIRKCPTCGRRTRPNFVKSTMAPGTSVRHGDQCTGCAPKTPRVKDTQNFRMPISRNPLTPEEEKVAQIMRDLSSTPEEADDLLAMLGLVREAPIASGVLR